MNDHTASRTIIIADDDPEMLLIVSSMVITAGYTPASVQNFESFKKSFTESTFAVMLDLVMPGKDSEKIMEHLASSEYKRPLLFITGSFPEDIAKRQARAHELGLHVTDVLIKPFWLEDVTRALKSLEA
jgi:DNA-binding NtrC family response regulator